MVDTKDRIVAGLGPTDRNFSVLEWAATQADHRGTTLQLVHAYTVPPNTLGRLYGYDFAATYREGGQALLDAAARDVAGRHPNLEVRTDLVRGSAAPVLVDSSATARMVVVGQDLDKPFPLRLHDRRTSNHLARHAHCPLVVVPHGWTEPDASSVIAFMDHAHPDTAALDFAVAHARQRHTTVTIIHLHGQPGRGTDWHSAGALSEACDEASLIVLGRRPPTIATMYGSLEQEFIAHATCPVAVIPAPKTAEWAGTFLHPRHVPA